MIFKIQRPLAGDTSQMLVYNKDRSVEFMLPFDGTARAWMGDAPKKYAHCHVKDGRLNIDQEIEDDFDW